MKINKITEQINIDTVKIDQNSVEDILFSINKEDQKVSSAVKASIPQISSFIEEVIQKLENSGRLIYIGSGTSGRLGVLDASECPPTFGVSKDLVLGIIAGGDKALKESIEGAEDSLEDSSLELKKIKLNKDDILLGISASGSTPYVLSALEYANSIGITTGFLTCNNIQDLSYVKHLIKVIVGPEVLTGSTRLKAGTATKMVLNMITTTTMMKLNHTFGNTMIDLLPKNVKLVNRAIDILKKELSMNKEQAQNLYQKSGEDLKIAILMGKREMSYDDAKKTLLKNKGSLSKSLNQDG